MERTVEHTDSEISAARLSEKLTHYWQHQATREALVRRLERAEAEKASVSKHIYEKVVADYQRELEAAESALEPMRAEVERLRGMCERERDDIRRIMADLEDRLAEAGFRQRVGEYTAEEVSSVKDEVGPRLNEQRDRLDEVEALITALDRPPAESATMTSSAPAPASAPTPAPSSQPAKPAEDPLAALADPSSGTHPADATVAAPPIERLVCTTGPSAGKTVSLDNATLSVGREHDNSIELKDPDVARYHARIVSSNGEFHIEDLASSTGTWLNGERVHRAVLSRDDVVRIGSTQWRFE